MDYVLIKNGMLALEQGARLGDVLICENKIVDIGSALSRPDLETPVIDAAGKHVLPGIIDINRNFYQMYHFDTQRLLRLLQAQIISGTTFWMDAISFKELSTLAESIDIEAFPMPDYSFHLLIDEILSINPEAALPLIKRYGITSLLLRWPLEEHVPIDQLGKVFDFAVAHKMVLVFELQSAHQYNSGESFIHSSSMVDYHMEQMNLLVSMVSKLDTRLCFLNVNYREELSVLKKLRNTMDVYAELPLSVFLGNKDVQSINPITNSEHPLKIHPLSASQVLQEVLQHDWCLIGKSGINVFNENLLMDGKGYNRPDDYFIFKYFLSILSSIPINNSCLAPAQLNNLLADKPSRLFNVAPVKGVLQVGADADLIIWDEGYERNLFLSFYNENDILEEYRLKGRSDFVFMKGKIVYNGEQTLNYTLSGDYLPRTQ